MAVVTGASSGIGKATAKALAAAGAKVALAARREETLQEIVSGIVEKDGQAIAVKTDVTNRAQVRCQGVLKYFFLSIHLVHLTKCS